MPGHGGFVCWVRVLVCWKSCSCFGIVWWALYELLGVVGGGEVGVV